MNEVFISGVFGAVLAHIAAEIVLKSPQQHNAARLLVSKERNGVVHPLLQIAETDNIAEGFDGIENAVRAGKCLN